MKLSKLLPAQSAIIEAIDGDTSFRKRLLELGFTEGALIHKLATHGSGLTAYRIRGAIYSLRQSEIEKIIVKETDLRG